MSSTKLEEQMERLIGAVQKLAEPPPPEIMEEPGPPICPNCGAFDPVVEMPAGEAGSGPLSEIFLDLKCMACGGMVFAIIESYSMHANRNTFKEEFEARKQHYMARRAGMVNG